ncbi:MAG: sugar transferase, partial [Planctomycetes bacterium]|nr:sugar transferase [Planctomycetota bacterium]
PIFAVAAIIIKASDRGPVLHWQTRVGKGGRVFRFPKFRSMVVGAEAMTDSLVADNHHGDDGVTFKIPQDPRITRFGRILRKTSIDELPQFWCVLRGDMSLVGPRPPTLDEVAKYDRWQRRRLEVTPGITCIWQVSGRCEIDFETWVRMDIEYAERRSFRFDLSILLRTIPAVLGARGAY